MNDLQRVSADIRTGLGKNSHRTWEITSSSVNLQSSRCESLAFTGERVFNNNVNWSKEKVDEPRKLMRSFLGPPALDSCLFESSSSLATLCASSLFHRRFCIPGSLDLSHNHVSNPGNHPTIDMNRRNNREGIPKDVKLANGADSQQTGTKNCGCPT